VSGESHRTRNKKQTINHEDLPVYDRDTVLVQGTLATVTIASPLDRHSNKLKGTAIDNCLIIDRLGRITCARFIRFTIQ
jgi:hypothetical protein